MLLQVSVAAATAALKYNLIKDHTLNQASNNRVLSAAGLKGSAAALDTEVEIYVGQTKVGNLFNTSTGAPNRDDMFPIGRYVPANEEVRAIVVDAPVTSPINLALEFQDLP